MDATFASLPYPTSVELEWLFRHGIPANAMAEPWPIKSASVQFLNGGTFDFARDGRQAIVFLAVDHGETVDLIAWQPKSGAVASWRATAFCLGDQDQCFNPASWFADSGLRVHADPLEWLKHDRDGIVIVRREFAYAYLRYVPRLVFADVEHAERIQRWCRPPKPKTQFNIDLPEAAA